MSPFARLGFAEEPVVDLNDSVLRAICARGDSRAGARVNAHPVAAELGIEANTLFRTVLALVDCGFLNYLGAGPTVEITELGARQCPDPGEGDREQE